MVEHTDKSSDTNLVARALLEKVKNDEATVEYVADQKAIKPKWIEWLRPKLPARYTIKCNGSKYTLYDDPTNYRFVKGNEDMGDGEILRQHLRIADDPQTREADRIEGRPMLPIRNDRSTWKAPQKLFGLVLERLVWFLLLSIASIGMAFNIETPNLDESQVNIIRACIFVFGLGAFFMPVWFLLDLPKAWHNTFRNKKHTNLHTGAIRAVWAIVVAVIAAVIVRIILTN